MSATNQQAFMDWLNTSQSPQQTLYFLLDGAACKETQEALASFQQEENIHSLFQDTPAESLSDVAPYLIRLPEQDDLFAWAVELGLKHNGGLFILSSQSSDELTTHYQSQLTAHLPDGKQAYFRFYDPGVFYTFCLASEPSAIRALKGEQNLAFACIRTQAKPDTILTVQVNGQFLQTTPASASLATGTQAIRTTGNYHA